MIYLGDLIDGGTHHFTFTTVDDTGLPTVLTGTPALRVYKDGNLTQSVAGLTLTPDFDGVVGLNHVALVLTDAFYVADTDYSIVIEAGTVGGVSVVGYVVAQFSISNRLPNVNVAQWLDTVPLALVAQRVNVSVGAMAASVLDAAAIAASAFTSGKFATDAISAGAFAQAAADKVWTSASRTLTAFSTALALSVWDVLESAILTGSSIGLKLKNNLDAAITSRATQAQIISDATPFLGASIAAILADVTGIAGAAMRGTDSAALASVATEARLAELDGANLPSDVDAIKAKTDLQPEGIKKNAAETIQFLMVLATDGRTPATGLSPTGQRSMDGAAYVAVTGTITELSNGVYNFNAVAADTNADTIEYRFIAGTADDVHLTVKTSP